MAYDPVLFMPLVTYMAMECYFHQQVCPNIHKNITIDKIHVEISRDVIFAGKNVWKHSTTLHRACKMARIHTVSYYELLFVH
jgi:hypothetical protein